MKSATMKALTVVVALLAAMTLAKSRSTTNSVENGQLLQAERAESKQAAAGLKSRTQFAALATSLFWDAGRATN